MGALPISPQWTLLTVISTERFCCQRDRSISVLSEQYETSYLFYVTLSFLCNIICYLISVFAFSVVNISGATTLWTLKTDPIHFYWENLLFLFYHLLKSAKLHNLFSYPFNATIHALSVKWPKKGWYGVKQNNQPTVIFWPSTRPKNAIPRWYTGRKWHIPMASNRKRSRGRIKAYDMGQGEGPIVPLQWCTGRE